MKSEAFASPPNRVYKTACVNGKFKVKR